MDPDDRFKLERPRSLAEVVYILLRDLILTGQMQPGEQIVETTLAERLGVSRTPVHRAIRQLAQHSLVTIIPGKGIVVTGVSSRDLKEIYDIRVVLECHIVQETTNQFTREEIEEIASILRMGDEALLEGDIVTFLESNRAFHHVFDKKLGNQRMSDILSNLDYLVDSLVSSDFEFKQNDLERMSREHWSLLEAVREEDVRSAVSLMRTHLRNTAAMILDRREDAQ